VDDSGKPGGGAHSTSDVTTVRNAYDDAALDGRGGGGGVGHQGECEGTVQIDTKQSKGRHYMGHNHPPHSNMRAST